MKYIKNIILPSLIRHKRFRGTKNTWKGDVVVKYYNKNILLVKKISLCVCLLVLSISFAGCEAKQNKVVKPNIEQVEPVALEPKTELIKVSKLTIKHDTEMKTNEVKGAVTNNNKMDLSFYIKIIYINKDGSLLIIENISIADVKSGENKKFSHIATGTDVSKATYKIQIVDLQQNADRTSN